MSNRPTYEQLQISDFIGEAEDFLSELEILLGQMRTGDVSINDAVHRINRIAHSIKGMAGLANFKLISKVAHKMEDFAASITELTDDLIEDLQMYTDTIRDLIDDYAQDREMPNEDILEHLPQKVGETPHVSHDFTVAPGEDIRTLIVVPDKTTFRFLTRELNSSGILTEWVSTSEGALEVLAGKAFHYTIIAAVLDHMKGTELVAAIRALPNGENIKLGLLSSYDKTHPELKGLPADVPVIHKSNVAEDVADALIQAGLF